tara:strand:+ start:1531 stop:1926 length:396 start_codon:yes stop_codon:yes gene_type:complete
MVHERQAGASATDVTINREREIERLENLAHWLDSRFRIPGTDIRFGLDAVAGLLPGIGDGGTALLSFYIVHQARRIGAPLPLRVRMTGNIVLDLLTGAIPLAGDLFDLGFKANRRNVALLREHFSDQASNL